MAMSDEDLGLLEQLCYVNKVADTYADKNIIVKETTCEKGPFLEKGKTIREMLNGFSEEALQKMEKDDKIYGGDISGKEWATIIRNMKKNENLLDLELGETLVADRTVNGTKGPHTLALCFKNPAEDGKAIVAFAGTTGVEEWEDNGLGLNRADTPCQMEALDFIESLPYDDVTVTGHSKGGNKAMYVSITSNKVTRCVAFDGQGFSQEFIDKYWAEIQAKKGNVSTYSLSSDFVHILLYGLPISDSKQNFCDGFGVDGFTQNHSPNSFFAGFDENGTPQFKSGVPENSLMTLFHQFTTFVLNNASEDEKEKIAQYMAGLLGTGFGSGGVDSKAMMDYAMNNPDETALILAYFLEYLEESDISIDELEKGLKDYGLNVDVDTPIGNLTLDNISFIQFFVSILRYASNPVAATGRKIKGLSNDLMMGIITLVCDVWGISSIPHIVSKTKSYRKHIHAENGYADKKAKTGKTRDFSQDTYNSLMASVNKVDSMEDNLVSSWNRFSGESWYVKLTIGVVVNCVKRYFEKLYETNRVCKTNINRVFNTVRTVDVQFSSHIATDADQLSQIQQKLTEMAESICI